MPPEVKNDSNVQRIVTAVVAGTFVFGPPVAMLAGVRPSAVDNRALAPAPSLDEGFAALDKVSPWATDRLAGRDDAVRTKAWIDFHLLKQMPASGKVVRGKDDYLYLGEDFTIACARDAVIEESLVAFGRMAEIIERSGRRAVVTLGPNKSSAVPQNLPDVMPTGDCAKNALARQNDILDTFSHPQWLGVRARLAAAHVAGEPTYSRTDTHWTTTGGAIFAKALAERLRPDLVNRITVRPGSTQRTGDLLSLLGLTAKETMSSAELSTGGIVTPDPRFPVYDPASTVFGKQQWTTSPAEGLVPGASLILGDSFAYASMINLRPLFAQGTFLWTGHHSERVIIDHVKASDTVVIEMVQRSLRPGHLFATPQFQAKLATALGVPQY